MYFRPGFLAKNERSNFSAKPIFLPYLKINEDRSQRLSCQVRALRWYIDRTRLMRGNVQQLFITNKKPFKTAARLTIATWLIETVKFSNALIESG